MRTTKIPDAPLGGGSLPPGPEADSKRPAERRIAPEPDLHSPEVEDDEDELVEEKDTVALPYPGTPGSARDNYWLHVRQQAEAIVRSDLGHERKQEDMLEVLAEMPKYIPAGFLNAYNLDEGDDLDAPKHECPDDQTFLQVTSTAQEVRALCDEFKALREVRIEVRLFSFKRKSRGRFLTGNARPVSLQDRQCYAGEGKPPHFQLEIGLAAWLVSNEEQRRAILHNAMMACELKQGRSGQMVAKKRQPDVVAYSETVMRFGATTPEIAKAALAVEQHPSTPERLEAWGIEPDGQGVLFPAYAVPKSEAKTL